MPPWGIVGIVLLGLIVLSFPVIVVINKMSDSAEKAAKASTVYKTLLVLNEKFNFKVSSVKLQYNRRTNFQKYNDNEYAREIFIKEIIAKDIDSFKELIRAVEHNRPIYPQYFAAYNKILTQASNSAEKRLLQQEELKPIVEPEFELRIYYTYYGENRFNVVKFCYSEIIIAVADAVKRIASQSVVQQERKLMTDKLRFDILKRDGFSCKICGKKASDGVSLEVDHIIPVSKGGRTENSNLQTLCIRCNRGKGVVLLEE